MQRKTLLILVWFSLIVMACNLSSTSQPPPTLVPRIGGATLTPPPTLGFATSVAGAAPQTTAVSPQQSQANIELYNLLNQVESDRMMLHIETLVNFHTRHINSSTTSLDRGVGAAFNYIQQQLRNIQAQSPESFTVFPEGHEFQATFNGITSTQRNAVAVLQGTEANAGIIVIGAHYDSRTDDLNDATAFAPGADDNGSGVAAVLEIARILSRKPQRATIIFVLFAAEEVGAQGSRAFVREYINPLNERNLVMINLDTIGNWNDTRGNINDSQIRVFSVAPNDSPSRQLARNLHFISYNYALDLEIDLKDGMDREGRYGDQLPFVENNYAAIRFVEALEETNMREGRDTIDGIEPIYLYHSTRTVLGTLVGLAGGPRPPENLTLRDNGNGTGSLVWETVPEATGYIVALRRTNSLGVSTQFAVIEPRTADWNRWWEFEAVYVATVDANGTVGPLSREYIIR